EYLFEVRDHNGAQLTITDPTNPRRVPGAFGGKAVLEFDGYAPPERLTAPPGESTESLIQVDAPDPDGTGQATVWPPAERDGPAPLLIAHDGPEFARLGGLTHYLGASIASGTLPPMRAALLGPGDRNAWYSANPAYATTLMQPVLDALDDAAPATVRIGL